MSYLPFGKGEPNMAWIRSAVAALVIMGFVAVKGLAARSESARRTAGMAGESRDTARPPGYVGSSQCRVCHERFYQLWASSHHGLAMQPFTPDFAKTELVPQTNDIVIGKYGYRAETAGETASVHEKGPEGEKKYPIHHVMGGKNVYFFLTPMERGRLQVLPVAFNVRTKKWYDTTASMVRHFLDRTDEPLHWTDRLLTFNTSCHGCHVSQMRSNYDFETDSYDSAWTEPGINCEACHGPAGEHIRVCKEAPEGQPPKDLEILVINRKSGYDAHRVSAQCAPCHAKMYPVSTAFVPGDRYFDHYGLITLGHPDFYPDGRDLGENYTYTSWLMSPCIKSGQLDCLHCHTSSGRYRFKEPEAANGACLPCHKEQVEKAPEHTRHKPDSEGNRCIACHMPMTEFALMRRSDHSMLPPTPAATIRFKSPNACNICHDSEDAVWADKYVRQWRKRDYQAPVLHRAGLIDAARKHDWSRLPEMLEYVERADRDEVFATSLVRLLQACPDNRKWPALLGALRDPSPLVRSAAAASLDPIMTEGMRAGLLAAAGDAYRVVRVSAAASLAGFPQDSLETRDQERLRRASEEYEAMLHVRLDNWSSHYNLGNYYADRGEAERALAAYATAMRLDPSRIPPHVNAAMVHARRGENAKAENLLRLALRSDPKSAEANFNLGLLLAELGNRDGAEKHLRLALETDPTLAQAAYNLSVLVSRESLSEAVDWCRKAAELRPDEPRYAYTLAFYLNQAGDMGGAKSVLKDLIQTHPSYSDAHLLLGTIYEKAGQLEQARDVYRQALQNPQISERERYQLKLKIRSLRGR
ncbi:MAG: hypothetical protein AMJ84_09550 [Acidithiobacillales bacterium SM23_46]|nr:MAG: hypothetical protein AMJ84_09550 [Acidithiobacillales bacterium SM23_46]